MVFVFNAAALFQIIISIAILALFQLFFHLFGSDINVLTGTRELPFSILFIAVVSMFLDLADIKGRLFYIPTWIVGIAASIITFHLTYEFTNFSYDAATGDWITTETNILRFAPLLYGFGVLMAIYYYRKWYKILKEKWALAQDTLDKTFEVRDKMSSEVFWKMASHIYFNPPFGAPLILQIIDKISSEDLLRHNQQFVNLINQDEMYLADHKKWMAEIKQTLADNEDLSYFQFQKLASIIDFKNEKKSE